MDWEYLAKTDDIRLSFLTILRSSIENKKFNYEELNEILKIFGMEIPKNIFESKRRTGYDIPLCRSVHYPLYFEVIGDGYAIIKDGK